MTEQHKPTDRERISEIRRTVELHGVLWVDEVEWMWLTEWAEEHERNCVCGGVPF